MICNQNLGVSVKIELMIIIILVIIFRCFFFKLKSDYKELVLKILCELTYNQVFYFF